MWINETLEKILDEVGDLGHWLIDGLAQITVVLIVIGFLLWFFVGFIYGLSQGEFLWGKRLIILLAWGIVELCWSMRKEKDVIKW